MSENGGIIADTTTRVFREFGSGKQRIPLWKALDEAGLARAWVSDAFGGAGATVADGFEVLKIAGSYAVDVPLAESLLAGWMLEQARLTLPDGVTTIAPVDARDRIALDARNALNGTARSVPFAREATQIAVLATRGTETFVAVVDRAKCDLTERNNLAGDARDLVGFNSVSPRAMQSASINFDQVMLMGAAIRSMQIAGALQAVLDLSATYANERVAFEKPIGKFQSIQHSLARLAGETAAAIAAAGSAADAINSSPITDEGVFLEVASAKIRTGEAVSVGAGIAHQVHGAIGFSAEHPLHRYTQRLWAWRDDFGAETYWAVRLGQHVARKGASALWPMLAAR